MVNYLDEFNKIMANQDTIALATSKDNIPNVRIVNFYYNKKGTLYFSTFADNAKVDEFAKNPKISFTTIPLNSINHARVTNALVSKSNLTIYDLKDEFIAKIPSYKDTIAEVGSYLTLYEVQIAQATVTLDFDHIETINIFS